MKKNNEIWVYVDDEIGNWLDDKAKNGYKKASLVRHIIKQYMNSENAQKSVVAGVAQ